jgi:hypothetical protein
MTRHVMTVTRELTLRELEALFEKHDFNSFPVIEEGKMLGIVTKFDFLQAFAFTTGQMVPHYDDLMRRPVGEMMTEAVVHVEPAAPLTRVLPVDGEPEGSQLSRYRPRPPIGGHHLPRGCDARPQRGHTGTLDRAAMRGWSQSNRWATRGATEQGGRHDDALHAFLTGRDNCTIARPRHAAGMTELGFFRCGRLM